MAKSSTLGKIAHAMNASGNMHPHFADVLFDLRNNSSQKAPPKVESNLEARRHVEYYYYYSTLTEVVRTVWLQLVTFHVTTLESLVTLASSRDVFTMSD